MKILIFLYGLSALTAQSEASVTPHEPTTSFSRRAGAPTQSVVSKNFSTQVLVLLAKHQGEVRVESPSGRLRLLAQGVEVDLGDEALIRAIPNSTQVSIGGISVPAQSTQLENTQAPYLIQVGGFFYRGPLKIGADGKQIFLVAELPLETYLKGTVGAEMPSHWEPEALKAQAVASRTYALTRLQTPKSPWYHIESNIEDQVFQSDFPTNRRVDTAVDSTAGLYLKKGLSPAANEKETPLKTFFHSRCGGQTETPAGAWASNENKNASKSVVCPHCRTQPGQWALEFPLAALSRALGLGPLGTQSVRVASLQRTPSGRVQSISFGLGDQIASLTGEEFRARVGYTRLKSTLFGVEAKQGRLLLKGAGAGHGVGMCQFGAQHMAKAGRTYDQILKYYYPLSRFGRLQ